MRQLIAPRVICNWVILVASRGECCLEFLLAALYLKLLWDGGPQGEVSGWPSFYRHVRGNAAGGEGRERRTVNQVGDVETVAPKSSSYPFALTSNSCVIRGREEQMSHVT